MMSLDVRKTRRLGDQETRSRTRSARDLSVSPCLPVSLSSSSRRAFTLIEMLVVVSILLIITVAVVAVAPRFTDDRKLARAADQLAQILLTAKQRAKRDLVPTGVRLFPDPQHNNLVTELQYIQQPDDFGPAGSTVLLRTDVSVSAPGLPAGWTGNVFLADSQGTVDFTGGFATNPTLWPVQAGDYLSVKGTPHLILSVFGVDPTRPAPVPVNSFLVLTPVAPFQSNVTLGAPGSNSLTLVNSAQIAVGMSVTGPWANNPPNPPLKITRLNNTTYPPSITLSGAPTSAGTSLIGFVPQISGQPTSYSVIRSPRVLTGETPLQLPSGICIDPNPKLAGDTNGFTPPQDIMFSPQGNVMNLRGVDSVVLWVRDYTKDVGPQLLPNQPLNTYPVSAWPPTGQPGDQFVILIQTHTGFIAEHPVDTTPNGNPYSFTQDARSSGL